VKILCIAPPMIPSYFNAGHRLWLFSVGAYLRKALPGAEVRCLDAAALNLHWKNVGDVLCDGWDVVCMHNDFDGIDGFERFIYYARRLCPGAKLVTFGRLSSLVPALFHRFELDAIVDSGDFEAGVEDAIRHLAHGDDPAGVRLRSRGFAAPARDGRRLAAEDWVLPDVAEIPYAAYGKMYLEDRDKFCGIPGRQELVVPVARGCTVGCAYCDVPAIQGSRERRLSVDRTVRYIRDAFAAAPFEYVSFYAPTFTLNRRWVVELCDALEPDRVPWKCVTTLAHLAEPLVARMGRAGCVRISVGLETLAGGGARSLPIIKQDVEAQLRAVAGWCRAAGIELNCFVILGLPGDSPEGVDYTIRVVTALGARVRPTIYTDYQKITAAMAPFEVAQFNRQLLTPDELPEEVAAGYHRTFFGRKDARTEVSARIPARAPDREEPHAGREEPRV
jgi:radical SAM superfamily enzyme YgiQ (UPF0313 family)